MKFIPVAGFLIALIAQYAWSGQIEIWEDDQGVTHIEYHKSNMQKTGLSAPQKYKKSNRQYKNFNQKLKERKLEIKRKAEAKIQKIRRKTEVYLKKQKVLGKRNINQTTGTIIGNCTKKWGNNHRMVEYCLNK